MTITTVFLNIGLRMLQYLLALIFKYVFPIVRKSQDFKNITSHINAGATYRSILPKFCALFDTNRFNFKNKFHL